MGKELYESAPEAREIIHHANDTLQMDLKSLMFEGPQDELTKTENAQPAILTANHAFFRLAEKKNFPYQGAAGHSLGEYNALVAVKSLSFEDALVAVRERGRLMEEVGTKTKGTMAAVLFLDEKKLMEACLQASDEGRVEIANYNCPGQLVISGEVAAVEKACSLAKEAGARRAIRLKVGGAFHSALMEEAAESFGEFLEKIRIIEPRVDLYMNVTGARESDPEKIKALLKRQLRSPVMWEKLIREMISDGFDSFTEVGPGNVLTGLVSQISKDVSRSNVNSLSALEAL